MIGVVLLLLAASIIRFSGAVLRAPARRGLSRTIGWLLSTVAAGMVMGAMGSWFPLWLPLAVGILGAAIDRPALRQWQAYAGFEIPLALICWFFSLSPLSATVGSTGVATVIAIGVGADSAARIVVSRHKQVPVRLYRSALAVTAVAGLSFLVVRPSTVSRGVQILDEQLGGGQLLHLGAMSRIGPESVPLETGAQSWLEWPTGEGPFPGALLFHGQHPDASMQTAAVVLRHALLDAGFVVLAVDQIGFGGSRTPGAEAPILEWDPSPTSHTALELLRSIPDVDQVFAVGHSMGATEVLRLLSAEPKIDGGIIFGGSFIGRSTVINDYWYERFHADRRLQYRLPKSAVLEIENRFEDHSKILEAADREHAPVLFVLFEREWPSVVGKRDRLYSAIPGQKQLWPLSDSTHYFSSKGRLGIVIGDTRITRRVSERLREFAAEQSERGASVR